MVIGQPCYEWHKLEMTLQIVRLPKWRLQSKSPSLISESWFGSSGGGLPRRP